MNERFHRRIKQIDEMNRLAEEVLPSNATRDDRYPVRFDHCFKRIAYDAAVGAQWDTEVQPPFYRHASDAQIHAAIETLNAMCEDPTRAAELNRQSLAYRNRHA
jgi:hypothetical protein